MSLCTSCPLSSTRQVSGHGPKDAKLIVVGEFPDKIAEQYGRAYHPGKAHDKESPSAIMRRGLKRVVGIDPDLDVYWIYSLRCNPYKKAKSVKSGDVKSCNHNVNFELSSVTAPLVLVSGPVAVQSVIGPKGGVTGNRLGWHNINLGNQPRLAMVTLSVNQVDRNSIYQADETGPEIERGSRWMPFGTGPYFFNQDLEKLRDKIQELGLV